MYLTVKEVANTLRISERKAYDYIREGLIPGIKIKGKILVSQDSLQKKLKELEEKGV